LVVKWEYEKNIMYDKKYLNVIHSRALLANGTCSKWLTMLLFQNTNDIEHLSKK